MNFDIVDLSFDCPNIKEREEIASCILLYTHTHIYCVCVYSNLGLLFSTWLIYWRFECYFSLLWLHNWKIELLLRYWV